MAKKKPAQTNEPRIPVGRPSIYSDALAAEICRLMAEEGLSMRAICARPGMPNRLTVIRWLADDRHAEFGNQYAHAREALADFHAEAIVEIADEEVTITRRDEEGDEVEVVFDAVAVARNRLRMDARKWYASKLNAKKYGDKLDVDLSDRRTVSIINLAGRGPSKGAG